MADHRDVIVGKNSKVWRAMEGRAEFAGASIIALGHRDVSAFAFLSADRVWILSYSRVPSENRALLTAIRAGGAVDVVYVSSASTNVVSLTNCYEYPRVKREAAHDAREMCGAKVLTIGVVYDQESQLPAGSTAATSIDDLASFMASPTFSHEGDTHLFRAVERPDRHAVEAALRAVYGGLLNLAMPYPCALRPLDLILRVMNMRWYGYLYLSNRLWFTTTS